MAWRMNVGGIDIPVPVPDQMVDLIKEVQQTKTNPAQGVWLQIGDQATEGDQQIFIPAGAPILLTRTENDPSELLYKFERGSASD